MTNRTPTVYSSSVYIHVRSAHFWSLHIMYVVAIQLRHLNSHNLTPDDVITGRTTEPCSASTSNPVALEYEIPGSREGNHAAHIYKLCLWYITSWWNLNEAWFCCSYLYHSFICKAQLHKSDVISVGASRRVVCNCMGSCWLDHCQQQERIPQLHYALLSATSNAKYCVIR